MTDHTPAAQAATSRSPGTNAESRRAIDPKRVLACGTCRKRKLKCDSKRPKCSTCARLGHSCEYDEVRKKSGPKRGYVKELEARLKQVETLLTTDQANKTSPPQNEPLQPEQSQTTSSGGMNIFSTSINENSSGLVQQNTNMIESDLSMGDDFSTGGLGDFNWDMISLGLEEPLPPQGVMDELYSAYFEKVHPSLPIIHRPRFMASLNLPMNQRPPVCLRYIIWSHACAMLPHYQSSAEQFYQKARRYIEQDEMRGHGESFISLQHAQAWILIATYEFKSMYFPRAWMSCGRATRLCQLMGLHRQDRVGLDVKQTMAPPKDWIEREERRRAFWMAYCNDRYASIGTGWPMAIDERDILTNLPASEEAYLTGKQESTPALSDVLAGQGNSGLSPFAGVCLLATLFGRNLTHLHRPTDDDNDHDLNGEFWKRHRSIDHILLNTSLSLPAHLRLPFGLNDPNIIFSNMNIHTSTICLHQAAIFKADKHRLPSQIGAESKRRCIVAADQITNIMKMCSHLDLATLNPFIAFCLYVAARVFVQYLKSKKEDSTVRASLTFLLSAMMALRNENPLTESFLVQLDVDLEGSGLNIPSPLGPNRYVNRPAGECPANTDSVRCVPIFEIRETQSLGQTARGVETIVSGSIDDTADFSSMGYNPMTHHHQPGRTPVVRVQSVSSSGSPAKSWDHNNGNPYPMHQKSPGAGDANSSSSHSNQPTPSASSSSNQNNSSNSYSPKIEDMPPFFSNPEPRLNAGYAQGPFVPGVLLSGDQSTRNFGTVHSHNEQNMNSNNNGPSSKTVSSSEFDFYGGTGFTPGPSGFTPGPSGFTPGPSGFTPDPTSSTPNLWHGMQASDNLAWMYDLENDAARE